MTVIMSPAVTTPKVNVNKVDVAATTTVTPILQYAKPALPMKNVAAKVQKARSSAKQVLRT